MQDQLSTSPPSGSKPASKSVEFVPPPNFMPPEGSGEGGEFDLVCSFKTKADGKLCLIRLGETEMPYDEHEKSQTKPSYASYSKSIVDGVGQESEVGSEGGGGY